MTPSRMPGEHVRAALRNFIRDEGAAVSLIAVATIFLVLAVAAIVIDAGSILYARRTLQTATDAAALSAAQHLDTAQTSATDVMTENGYGSGNISEVSTGTYTADEATPRAGRFVTPTPANGSTNSVRVRTTGTAPTYFARVFGRSSLTTISAESTAAIRSTASFQAGTRLAQLQNGLANKLLGGLLGTTVSLSAVDYNGLLGANVSALAFLNALATQVSLSSTSTYGDLLNTNATVGQILNASLNVLQDSSGTLASGSVSSATSAVKTLLNQLPLNKSVKISQIISAPALVDRTVATLGNGGDSPEINAYGIVAATARASGAGTIVNLGSALTIPLTGTTVNVKLAVGEGMQSATGPVGTSLTTSQVRLLIDLKLADTSATQLLTTITATSIDLPLYVEAAQGTATIDKIPCTSDDMVDLVGQTGAVKLQYGTVASGFASFPSSPTVTAGSIASVKLLGIPVAQINATGSTTVVANGPETHNFSSSDIQAGTVQTVPSNSDGKLIADNAPGALHTSVTLLGSVSLGLLNVLLSSVTSTLLSALALLDAPVSNLLTTLGVGLGVMDMSVTGAKCGVPVLVG